MARIDASVLVDAFNRGYRQGRDDMASGKTGKWVRKDDNNGIFYHTECSLCHERPLRNRWVDDNQLSPYCPWCGAKMESGEVDG